MTSVFLDTNEKKIWNENLDKFSEIYKDIYFFSEYLKLYETNKSKGKCFIYNDEDKIFFYPFIVRDIENEKNLKDIITPYGYGGPICNSKDKKFINFAIKLLYKKLMEMDVVAELIKFHPLIKNHEFLIDCYPGQIKKICNTVYVDLLNISDEHRWKNVYSHANRKKINKALKNKINIKFSNSTDYFEKFKEIYELNLKDNKANKKYFFNEDYYKKIKENLSDNFVLANAFYENKISSSQLLIYGKKFVHCHLLGTLQTAKSTGITNLLHHEFIKWSKNKGFISLHLGGGLNNRDDDSVLNYKKNFSNTISTFYIGENIINQNHYKYLCEKNSKNKKLNKIFKYRNEDQIIF